MQAKSLLNNSVANLLRAASASAVSVIVPLVLAWRLPHDQYAMWSLLFGIAAYVLFLDFGLAATLQVAAAKLSVGSASRSPKELVRRTLVIVAVIVACVQIAAAILGNFASALFPALPAGYLSVFGMALFVVCFGQSCSLASNILVGYFMGSHRTMKPSVILLLSRLTSVAGVSIISFSNVDLILVASIFSAPLVAGCLVIVFDLLRDVREFIRTDFSPRNDGLKWTTKSIISFSAPLALWNLALLVVTGSGVWIIGQADYTALGAYSIAAMMVTVVLGLENAILGPLLSELSQAVARSDGLARYIRKVSLLNSVFVMAIAVLIFGTFNIFHPLLPESIGQHLTPEIVGFLLFGNVVRLSLAPLGLAFVANGSHKRLIFPPIVEALLYFVALYTLGRGFGLVGVAIGTIVGAVLGSGIKLLWSIRIAPIPSLGIAQLARETILIPSLCILPIAAVVAVLRALVGSVDAWIVWIIGACCLSLFFLVFLCVPKGDRGKLRARLSGQTGPSQSEVQSAGGSNGVDRRLGIRAD